MSYSRPLFVRTGLGGDGTSGTGPTGPQGPAGSLSSFSVNGASTNSLLYYDGNTVSGISSLFYYSSINTLSANLDVIPCLDNLYNLPKNINRSKLDKVIIYSSPQYIKYYLQDILLALIILIMLYYFLTN